MKTDTLAGARALSDEPPRSTAYYYADLERLKRRNGQDGEPIPQPEEIRQNSNELSEYVETNEVINDGAISEVPPLRDRQWGLPEYSTPDGPRKVPEETYSTAGTFPMPQQKEKEPLLAELEIVGRLPLTQLDSSSSMRRSRSWYLCCPNVGDEEISRESSWRYSSLRPVTAPPMPGQNGTNFLLATQSSERVDDAVSLRAERDALVRALAAERQRAATAARAHDARLAELHGVIAELVRRRAADKHAKAIPEEEVSDECESTTQPAGDLENDADRSRTDQNDTSSMMSPAELPTPQEAKIEELHQLQDTIGNGSKVVRVRAEKPYVEVSSPPTVTRSETDNCDTSLNLSERDSELCLNTARCCQYARTHHSGGDSCEREHGSTDDTRVYTASPGRRDCRQAKIASRVRLKRTEDMEGSLHIANEDAWCAEAAEKLALDVCAQADLREALVAASNDEVASTWRARCARMAADCRVLECALARAADTAHRLSCACAIQESCCVSLCCALRCADRALETYDVLLALAETAHTRGPEREAAELVARQLLARLDSEQTTAAGVGEPLLSPGPWLQHHNQGEVSSVEWTAECETRLRQHAARLKTDTVTLRTLQSEPHLFSYHDIDEKDLGELVGRVGSVSMLEMEAAVMMQEVLSEREMRAVAKANGNTQPEQKTDTNRSRRRRHWLDAPSSETDL